MTTVCVDDFSIFSSSNCFDNSLDSKSLVCLPSVNFDGLIKTEFVRMQNDDDSVTQLWEWARYGQKIIFVLDGVLLCLTSTMGHISHAIVVPRPLTDVKMHVQSWKTCLKYNKDHVPKAPFANQNIW